jgi:hypothetical protein
MPCSPLKVNRCFGETYHLHLQGQRINRARNQRKSNGKKWVSCSAYFSALKMEAICFSETSIDFQRTTRRYITEESTLRNYRCENLKSYKKPSCLGYSSTMEMEVTCSSEGGTSHQGHNQSIFTLWRVLSTGIQRRVVRNVCWLLTYYIAP